MKKMIVGLVVLCSTFNILAEPGGTYTLTGKEKGLTEIIKADMEQFPDLYIGESLSSYTSKFKKENNIGKQKLSPGDKLTFPETLTSIRLKKDSVIQAPEKPSASRAIIIINPIEGFKEDCWSQIKTSLEDAGYSTKVNTTAKNPAEGDGDICIRIRIDEREIDEDVTWLAYNGEQNKKLAECIGNQLAKTTGPRIEITTQENWGLFKQPIPSIVIRANEDDVYKYAQRYAEAITKGISDFLGK